MIAKTLLTLLIVISMLPYGKTAAQDSRCDFAKNIVEKTIDLVDKNNFEYLFEIIDVKFSNELIIEPNIDSYEYYYSRFFDESLIKSLSFSLEQGYQYHSGNASSSFEPYCFSDQSAPNRYLKNDLDFIRVYVIGSDSNRPSLSIWSPSFISPSFECLKANNETELAICKSKLLASLDNEMQGFYNEAKKYLFGDLRKNLVSNQRMFLRSRDKCLNDFDCIEHAYALRISELKKNKDSSPIVTVSNLHFTEKFKNHLSGDWVFEENLSIANCSPNGQYLPVSKVSIEGESLLIEYFSKGSKFNNVFKSEGKVCSIQNIEFLGTLNAVDGPKAIDLYRDRYFNRSWGTCGGEEDKIKSASYYIVFRTDICGSFALTGNDLDTLMFQPAWITSSGIEYELGNGDFTRAVTILKKENKFSKDPISLFNFMN